jgi:hypothetical protein
VGGNFIVVRPARPFRQELGLLDDDGLVTIGGTHDASGAINTVYRVPRSTGPHGESFDAEPAAAAGTTQGEITQQLEGKISDVITGGGGRYLLVVLKDVRKLVIFDVSVPAVVKSIPLPSDKVLVAAGARKFVIAFPEERLLQRWDFRTLASEGGFRPLPVKGELRALVMGSHSDGPILAMWVPERRTHAHQLFSFVDLSSLEVLRIGPVQGMKGEVSQSRGSFNVIGAGWGVRSSSGCRLLAFSQHQTTLFGFVTALVREGTLSFYGGEKLFFQRRDVHEYGFVAPGADGESLFVGLIGRVDAFGRDFEATGDPSQAREKDKNRSEKLIPVPSASPYYYVNLRIWAAPNKPWSESQAPLDATVHAAGDGLKLLAIPAMQEMTGFSENGWFSGPITLDKRFNLVPAARRLVTIPPQNDRLVIRSVDVESAVIRAEHIVILSTPLLNALAGVPFRGRIEARSSLGDVRFELVEGPKGLTVSPDGEISWPSPELPDGLKSTAVFALKDAAGRQATHKMVVRVR